MTLSIKKYPSRALRKKCEKVKEITPEIKQLAENMAKTMIENQGIGLAAPQVGELKRIIVVRLISERVPAEKAEAKPRIFINPKIVKKSKEALVEEEGCLSFSGVFLKIKRAKRVEVEALNEKGEKIYYKAEGLPARVFQHEIDHLDGILFIDRLGFWQKLKLKLCR